MPDRPLLEMRSIHRGFAARGHLVKAVDDVSLVLHRGETLGVVGESGSGKSTLGRIAIGLEHGDTGEIVLDGEASPAHVRSIRPRTQMVFQDPYSSLNPRMTVGRQVAEALVVAGRLSKAEIRDRVNALLEQVGLRAEQAGLYPHEFSGGQRQRIAIARALAPSPALVVADEPVSALDVSVQAQILNLMVDIQRESGLAYLFIAHDIAVVAHISHAIIVMYRGRVVERGLTHEVVGNAQHPYTRTLLDAVPRLGRRRSGNSAALVPTPATSGCSIVRVSPTHEYAVETA